MLISIIYALLVGWFPGAMLFRAPIANRARRFALPLEERVFWAVTLSLTYSLSVVIALAWVGQYTFQRLIVADIMVGVGVATAARTRLRVISAKAPGWTCLVPVGLIALGLWRFFPPSEYVIGGRDPGVYISEGIQIAQHGSLVVRDPLVAGLPKGVRDVVLPASNNHTYYSERFMGYYVRDPDIGTVVGGFPHLYPAAIAIGYELGGLYGARGTAGVWAILGLLAVYFAGTRLLQWPAAAAASGLLGLNVLQVWYARYPNSEIVMQALVFAALLAYARGHVDQDRFFAPLSGAILGLLLFDRVDATLAIAAVSLAAVLGSGRDQRPTLAFLTMLGIFVTLNMIYLFVPLRQYIERPLVFIRTIRPIQWGLVIVGSGLLAALWRLGQRSRLGAIAENLAPLMLIWLMAAGATYAYFFRAEGAGLAYADAQSLRVFTWYISVPGLLAALIGYAIVTRRSFRRDPALVLAITVFSAFVFYKMRITSDHFWAARRFLPVILPGALLLAAAAAITVPVAWTKGRIAYRLVGTLLLVSLGALYVRAAHPVLRHVEYDGMIRHLEQLAAGFKATDLILMESRDAGSDVHVLGLPLAYIFTRNVLVLPGATPNKSALRDFLDWAWTRYDRVFFLGSGGTDLLSRSLGFRPVISERFVVPEYERPANRYPRAITKKEFEFSVYELTLPLSSPGPRSLDIGTNDDLFVVRFHAKEITDGRSFRWTQDQSFVSLLPPPPAPTFLRLWMSNGGRPGWLPPATVQIYLAEAFLGSAIVGADFDAYTFRIPHAIAATMVSDDQPTRLRLVTSIWNPHVTLGTGDTRDLGIMLERVDLQ